MKFSYAKLKELVPSLPPIAELAERVTRHLFEVESAENGIIDVKILPNRHSDAACYFGFAREIAAISDAPLALPKLKKPKVEAKRAVQATIAMPALCKRIITCPVLSVEKKASPAWMQEILKAHGMRPISAVVDITNYVTLETGQPLHAFDLDKLMEGGLTVRQAREGEALETLDGAKLILSPSTLVISDAHYALDIAGVKGGKRAEISETTENIVLTAANFDGGMIYKASRRVDISTDASVRFAHGLAPALAETGLYRALDLIKEICGGTAGKIQDAYPKPEKPAAIAFDAKRFASVTGFDVAESECLKILKGLGFSISGKKATPPPERTDIALFEDLAEEIARCIGYDRLEATAPRVALMPTRNDKGITSVDIIRTACVGFGLTEAVSRSFASEGEIALENPLSSNGEYLRASLIPALKYALDANLRFAEKAGFFEIGHVFHKKATHEPKENVMVAIACAEKGGDAEEIFRKVRGMIEQLLEKMGTRNPDFKEEGKAEIKVYGGGEMLGWIGYETGAAPRAFAELDVEKLARMESVTRQFEALPKFPKITRDISLSVDRSMRVGEAMKSIEGAGSARCETAEFLTTYEGKGVPEGKKSMTFRLTFAAPDRTLSDAEADAEMKAMLERIANDFPFEVR